MYPLSKTLFCDYSIMTFRQELIGFYRLSDPYRAHVDQVGFQG